MEQHEKQTYFQEIYEKEIDSIFRFIFLRVSSKEEALDVTGEVFLKFWQVINNGQKPEFERAFLFTIARNKVIDWYRKKKPESLESLMSDDEGNESEFYIADPLAYEQILLTSEAKFALEAINKLPVQYREIMTMRFIQDLSLSEIANILNITENAVSIRLNRAMNNLKAILHSE